MAVELGQVGADMTAYGLCDLSIRISVKTEVYQIQNLWPYNTFLYCAYSYRLQGDTNLNPWLFSTWQIRGHFMSQLDPLDIGTSSLEKIDNRLEYIYGRDLPIGMNSWCALLMLDDAMLRSKVLMTVSLYTLRES